MVTHSYAAERRKALYRDEPPAESYVRAARAAGWDKEIRGPVRRIPYDGTFEARAELFANCKTQAQRVLIEHCGNLEIREGEFARLNKAIGWYSGIWACWICGVPPRSRPKGGVTIQEMEAADETFWSFLDEITVQKQAAE